MNNWTGTQEMLSIGWLKIQIGVTKDSSNVVQPSSKEKELVLILEMMDGYLKVGTKMVREMDPEDIIGLMATNMKVNIRMINDMEKESFKKKMGQ